MLKSQNSSAGGSLTAKTKAQWETPTVRKAGHLGTVLQAKCIISEDDTGISQYKTPGHDSGGNTC